MEQVTGKELLLYCGSNQYSNRQRTVAVLWQ